eukprot:g14842.t1
MSTITKKYTAEILDSVRVNSQGKLFLNINSSKDYVPFDEVEIPVHVRRKYELGNADPGGLVRGCVYFWSKKGILNKVKPTPWDDGLGEQPKNKRPKRPTNFLKPEEPKEPARKKKKGGEGEDEEKMKEKEGEDKKEKDGEGDSLDSFPERNKKTACSGS